MKDILTPLELSTLSKLGDIFNDFCEIIDDGSCRECDLTEAIDKIHQLQNMILAQAAGRHYPDFRTLGQSLSDSCKNCRFDRSMHEDLTQTGACLNFILRTNS